VATLESLGIAGVGGVAPISVAMAGLYAFKTPFWAPPNPFLSRSSAAVSSAALNPIGDRPWPCTKRYPKCVRPLANGFRRPALFLCMR
jgi:hypothetical protein